MPTKADLAAQLDEASVSHDPKATKAELEALVESVEVVAPEETPAPQPKPDTVRLVAPPGVTMDGISVYPDGVRVHWTKGYAIVDRAAASVVTRREAGVTVEQA